MGSPLRVLIVEDSEDDALLLLRYLRQSGYDPLSERVYDPETMAASLAREPWDIILADYSLPGFSGLDALNLLNKSGLDVPFVVVSGTIGEEAAVELMKAGARDYVRKGHLARLTAVIAREIQESAQRRERRQEQAELEAARQRLLEAEIEKKRFYREVIRAVTNGKLQLVDGNGIPNGGERILDMPLDGPQQYALLRQQLRAECTAAGMTVEDAEDMVLAVGEAVTNAIKHARDSRCVVYRDNERLIARVADHGEGIHLVNLPATILEAGFSTKVSLGMGYTIMLQLMDCLWLATGAEGTIVQLEKLIHPAAPSDLPVVASWAGL